MRITGAPFGRKNSYERPDSESRVPSVKSPRILASAIGFVI
jgi:hypothetical protein